LKRENKVPSPLEKKLASQKHTAGGSGLVEYALIS